VSVSSYIWGTRPDFYYCKIVASVLMWGILSEERTVIYNYCWSSPAQSFSGPSPGRLMTKFYCLRFESPSTLRVRSPYLYAAGTGWHKYTKDTGFPFRRLLRIAGLRWRYSNPSPHRSQSQNYFATGGLPPISPSWRQPL
jgi:hypothetical protein